MPNGSIIIINTRYHFDDLCGWLLKQESEFTTEPWEVISIPAWLDETAALLGLPEGTSYFPEWKPDDVLLMNKKYEQVTGVDTGCAIHAEPIARRRWDYQKELVSVVGIRRPTHCEFIIQTYDTAFLLRKRQTIVLSRPGASFTKLSKMSTAESMLSLTSSFLGISKTASSILTFAERLRCFTKNTSQMCALSRRKLLDNRSSKICDSQGFQFLTIFLTGTRFHVFTPPPLLWSRVVYTSPRVKRAKDLLMNV